MSHQDMSSLKWLSGTRIQNQGAEEPGKPGKRMASEVGRQNSSLQEYGLEDLMTKDTLRTYILFISLSFDCQIFIYSLLQTRLSARNII